MQTGDILDERFVLQANVRSGGMGAVWRALDQKTGKPVAVKLLRDPEDGDNARFLHEARLLSTLEHRNIVHYVAHGRTSEREPFLVMEWLDGEDLAQRLAREGLTMEETLVLVKGVASALGAAHARGVVHRDIKPSNLFLVGGDVLTVKILDFGIARVSGATENLTLTGTILGTPGYMAPEQARGERQLGPECDVFSLGCILFECLTGRGAFQGAHIAAQLAKLLFEGPPNILEVRPDLPVALGSFVSRMLARDPEQRLHNGAAVLAALEELERTHDFPPADANRFIREVPVALTITERRLVFVVAAVLIGENGLSSLTEASVAGIRQAVAELGAQVEVLANGMILAMLIGAGNPGDRATAAARCALRMYAMLPECVMTLMAGRSETKNRLPVGEVVEKAATILTKPSIRGPRAILIDSVTQALLDTRFEIFEDAGGIYLQRERAIGEEPRTLLGKPSPFVGRDRELRHLHEQIEASFEEKEARAIVVTGPAGMGKSRLRQELLRRLIETVPDLVWIIGRADSLGAGAAYASLGSALRSWFEVEVGEPLEKQRDKVCTRVKRFVGGDDVQRVVDFIGELVGVPFPDEDRPRLHAARQNAQIMAAQIELAYVDLTRAIVANRPTVLVLEDLHWGDSASVKLVDAALRELSAQSLVVVAFARPEVHDIFPKLWSGRNLVQMGLTPLNRRAAENLAKKILGETVTPEQLEMMIERSGGNAFYLEEMIRAVATGQGHALPDTVLGMVEARLVGFAAESRRLLRAASIFGQTFWVAGLRVLLGDANVSLRDVLDDLVAQEVVIQRNARRFAGEEEYAFRHALVRDGAYAMLSERDKSLGHKLAAEWLERVGEQDPLILATHFEFGGERQKAAHWRAMTAERTLQGGDPRSALVDTAQGWQWSLTRKSRPICGQFDPSLDCTRATKVYPLRWRQRKKHFNWPDPAHACIVEHFMVELRPRSSRAKSRRP